MKNPILNRKVALDALLEMYNDEDYATHQHHSDPDFTTQNGKDMGKGTEVEEGALNAAIPAALLASKVGYDYAPFHEDEEEYEDEDVFEPRTFIIPAGTILYHGTDLKQWNPKTTPITSPAWFSHSRSVAEWFSGWHDDSSYKASHAIVEYRTTQPIEVVVIDDSEELEALCEKYGVEMSSTNEMAEELSRYIDGWIIPTNYPDGDDTMLCDTSSLQFVKVEKLKKSASMKCVACENGDCMSHGDNTVSTLTHTVISDTPTVQDATFFKESDDDEFSVTRTASGQLVVADVKSYGVGTPIGGTANGTTPASVPSTSGTTAQPQTPTTPPASTVPPVNSINKTPNQLSQDAQNSAQPLSQQQVQQVVEALKTSAKTSAIEMKPTPTSLPPRDDMRRHLDEGAKDEIMEDVKDKPISPAPTQVQAQPQQPPAAALQPTAEEELLKQTLASKVAEDEQENADYGEIDKQAVQTEDGVNKVCPACNGRHVESIEDSDMEDGSLVECLDCGCFFAV